MSKQELQHNDMAKIRDLQQKEKEIKDELTAASTFAGDSSLGLESIDMILSTMLSTCVT